MMELFTQIWKMSFHFGHLTLMIAWNYIPNCGRLVTPDSQVSELYCRLIFEKRIFLKPDVELIAKVLFLLFVHTYFHFLTVIYVTFRTISWLDAKLLESSVYKIKVNATWQSVQNLYECSWIDSKLFVLTLPYIGFSCFQVYPRQQVRVLWTKFFLDAYS